MMFRKRLKIDTTNFFPRLEELSFFDQKSAQAELDPGELEFLGKKMANR